MYSKIIVAVIFVASLNAINGQVISLGRCPSNVQVMPNFKVASYLGDWYEYAKYPTVFQPDGKCTIATYTLRDDGKVGVYNRQENLKTGEIDSIEGYATEVENGKLLVVFPGNSTVAVSSNYWVLESDYESYSVVYSCQNLAGLTHATTVWILVRDRSPSAQTISTAKGVIERNCISLDPLVETDQTCCQLIKK